jgi:hypothetical protein
LDVTGLIATIGTVIGVKGLFASEKPGAPEAVAFGAGAVKVASVTSAKASNRKQGRRERWTEGRRELRDMERSPYQTIQRAQSAPLTRAEGVGEVAKSPPSKHEVAESSVDCPE